MYDVSCEVAQILQFSLLHGCNSIADVQLHFPADVSVTLP